jgi:putative ABC transport system permease protein
VAVSYQVLIILMIAAGAALGSLISAKLVCKQLFDERERLRLDRYRDTH